MTTETDAGQAGAIEGDATLLIVDDDRPFLTRLARAMESRGFRVDTGGNEDRWSLKGPALP